MEAILDQARNSYHYAMTHKSDPRVIGWPLLDSPLPMLALTSLYLIIVYKGPQWMAKRPAYDLKHLLVLYNLALVILSSYMFWELFANSILNGKFSLICQPVDYTNRESAQRLANVIWWYYISKIIEFMDTFFFILRKKQNQVTFLHVYHHSTMVVLWYIGAKFVAGGESYYSATINSFIHILMYTYYLLSAFGPAMQKYLWWKKYMTSLQLVQFVAIIVHTSYAIYVDCGYPVEYEIALILYAFSHVLLFGNFYYHSYMKKSKSKKTAEKTHQSNGKVSQSTKNINDSNYRFSSHHRPSGTSVRKNTSPVSNGTSPNSRKKKTHYS